MIDENATITDLVNNGLMRDSAKYVKGVCGNCYRQYQERGWLGEHIRIRIGRTGNGTSPHYTLEYVSDQYAPGKEFVENGFDKRNFPQQFSGPSHEKAAIGLDRSTWSKSVQTLAEIEDLKKRIETGNLRLP